jgi:hypothetical protein
MRYLVGCVCVLALVALPQSASAQGGEEAATSESNLQQPAPSPETAEEPALQLKLDDAGVGVVPSPPRTPDGYTLEEMELRVKRANIGLGVSAGVAGAGAVMMLVASSVALAQWGKDKSFDRAETAIWTGVALVTAGLAGTVASAILLRRRTRERNWLRRADYGTPRRVQWDLAQSRLAF